jgi:hypothetical protein
VTVDGWWCGVLAGAGEPRRVPRRWCAGVGLNLLSAQDLTSLLAEVGRELEHRGSAGQLFIVGGAAMALAYSRRRVTRDIDAVFEPKEVIYAVARKAGDRHGLPDGWLNDSVKGFLPGGDPNATVLFDRPGLMVRIASPEQRGRPGLGDGCRGGRGRRL